MPWTKAEEMWNNLSEQEKANYARRKQKFEQKKGGWKM